MLESDFFINTSPSISSRYFVQNGVLFSLVCCCLYLTGNLVTYYVGFLDFVARNRNLRRFTPQTGRALPMYSVLLFSLVDI